MAHDEESFNKGWNEAIAEVQKEVAGYLEAKQEGRSVDPWEEWLPRLLCLLSF